MLTPAERCPHVSADVGHWGWHWAGPTAQDVHQLRPPRPACKQKRVGSVGAKKVPCKHQPPCDSIRAAMARSVVGEPLVLQATHHAGNQGVHTWSDCTKPGRLGSCPPGWGVPAAAVAAAAATAAVRPSRVWPRGSRTRRSSCLSTSTWRTPSRVASLTAVHTCSTCWAAASHLLPSTGVPHAQHTDRYVLPCLLRVKWLSTGCGLRPMRRGGAR